jgi:hypothetical protein
MKRLTCVLGAAALISSFVLSDEASARRVGIGGGVRGVGVGAVGVRGVGFRGVGVGAVGVRTVGIGGGIWRPGLGVGWRPGLGWAGGWGGWGGGWGGWGFPIATGIAVSSGWGYPNDSCLAWNGYGWVNVCYRQSPFGYW